MIDLAETLVVIATYPDGRTTVDVDTLSVRFVDLDDAMASWVSFHSDFNRGDRLAHLWDVGVMSPSAEIRRV